MSYFYFAYGSNMNVEVLKKLGVEPISQQKAQLRGYRLVFNKIVDKLFGVGLANLDRSVNSLVEGVLYEIKEEDIPKLDELEGVPDDYFKMGVSVTGEDGRQIRSFAYLAHPEKVGAGLKPSRQYLQSMLVAATWLSKPYVEILEHLAVAR
jgi:gamma-glutamylcyclotransferase (GGCT)/AIG2-like uncharacterized protein YtfP